MKCYFYACFGADRLVLDNQLVYSFLEKTVSLVLSIPHLPAVLCVVLRPLGLSQPTLACLLLLTFFRLCLGSHIGETLWCIF